jgi:DNA-binding LytR/AlgR family response regulator
MKIRCIAVDDEPLALEKIKGYIKKIKYLDLLECFTNGAEAMSYIRENQVDLIFLDIQMEELSGIQMLEAMTVKPRVILTTAYDSYALKGYELDVSDYLLKPISFQRFLKAVDKIYTSLEAEKATRDIRLADKEKTVKPQPEINHLFVKSGHATVRVNFDDILFVEGMKDYLRIWTADNKIMTLMSFKNLEDKLPAHEFVRIHKSYLVSIGKIESIERSRVKIAGEYLPVGESYKRNFLSLLEKRRAD